MRSNCIVPRQCQAKSKVSMFSYPDRVNDFIQEFLPELFTNPSNFLAVGVVKDRTDAKLVHLDGLNFSRSWCLSEIAAKLPASNAKAVNSLAKKHLAAALPNVVSGNYSGEHWLASFAVYALSKADGDD